MLYLGQFRMMFFLSLQSLIVPVFKHWFFILFLFFIFNFLICKSFVVPVFNHWCVSVSVSVSVLAFVCIICMYSIYIMCIYSMYVFDTYAPTHNVYMCPVCPGFGFTGSGFRPFDDVRFVQGSSMTKYVEGLGLYRV